MINNYNFDKKIIKDGNNYILEITIPSIYNNFFYKIYGSDGFYNYGKYSSFTNLVFNHKLTINIDKIQNIFINIVLKKNNNEYYDFVNMNEITEKDYEKNIKMNIKKKYNDNNTIDEIKEDSDDEDSDDEDSDAEDSDAEDSNDEKDSSDDKDSEDNKDSNELESFITNNQL
jgi:Ran GTPase-activating protein (RanGAP) involved in mRNA processing and transport